MTKKEPVIFYKQPKRYPLYIDEVIADQLEKVISAVDKSKAPKPILQNKRQKVHEEKRSTQPEQPPRVSPEVSSPSIPIPSKRVELNVLDPQNPPYRLKLRLKERFQELPKDRIVRCLDEESFRLEQQAGTCPVRFKDKEKIFHVPWNILVMK